MTTYSDHEQRQLDIASGAELDRAMDQAFTKWLREARRAAVYLYCLPDLPDIIAGDAEAAHGQGKDPCDYVRELARRFKLVEARP
jgi:hypothetical protein